MTPGPPAYLTVKTKGDCSMPRKREQSEGAYDWDLQGLCNTVRAKLFEPEFPAMLAYIP